MITLSDGRKVRVAHISMTKPEQYDDQDTLYVTMQWGEGFRVYRQADKRLISEAFEFDTLPNTFEIVR